MPIKLQRWIGRHGRHIYDDGPLPCSWPTEKLTAYTEEEEAAHIREIVTLALANVDPADFDRCGPEELVDRTIRAMGSATSAKGRAE